MSKGMGRAGEPGSSSGMSGTVSTGGVGGFGGDLTLIIETQEMKIKSLERDKKDLEEQAAVLIRSKLQLEIKVEVYEDLVNKFINSIRDN